MASGPLHHASLVGLTGAFAIIKYAVYGALAAFVFAVVGIVVAARRRTGMSTAVTALILAGLAIGYGGAEVAAKQRASYPEIAPAELSLPPDRAFDRALAAAHAMGWEVVLSDPAGGRIEATDTTFWFGFKDDVVVRVIPQPTGSRVDVRSLSRVGGGDIGANAARIRAYLAKLKDS